MTVPEQTGWKLLGADVFEKKIKIVFFNCCGICLRQEIAKSNIDAMRMCRQTSQTREAHGVKKA